jgi:hypothetical protein
MPKASVRANIDMTFNARRKVTSQIAFYSKGLVNGFPEIYNFFVCQYIRFLSRIDGSLSKDFQSGRTSNAVYVRQADLNTFVAWQLNASDARHAFLSSLLYEREMFHPCRCLWREFSQITRIILARLMILHFRQIGFTEARTFIDFSF